MAGVLVEALVADAAQILEQLHKVMAELDPDECVHEGVQGAPQESHALGDVGGEDQAVEVAAVLCTPVDRVQGGQHQDKVVRQLAEQEDGNHRKDDLDRLVLLEAPGLPQGPNDGVVAEAHDQEGHAKAQDHLADLDAHTEVV